MDSSLWSWLYKVAELVFILKSHPSNNNIIAALSQRVATIYQTLGYHKQLYLSLTARVRGTIEGSR